MKKTHKIIKVGEYLYVLSDDEIKEGDLEEKWVLCVGTHERNSHPDSQGIFINPVRKRGKEDTCKECRKIVATNDPRLLEKLDTPEAKAQSVAKKEAYIPESIKHLVTVNYPAKLPDSLIQDFVDSNGTLDEIEVEYEEVHDGYELYSDNVKYKERLKLNPSGEIIWSPKEQKMYTRQDLLNLADDLWNTDQESLYKRYKSSLDYMNRNYPQ